MTLKNALEGKEYFISNVDTDDSELEDFLFSLGCYCGEKITLISHIGSNFIVAIKNGRYSIDKHLAKAITVTQK